MFGKRLKFESDKKARGDIMAALGLFWQIGISMVVTVGISLYLGHWIDRKIGSGPIFLLVFLVIGVGGAIKGMLNLCSRFYEPGGAKEPEDGKAPDGAEKGEAKSGLL